METTNKSLFNIKQVASYLNLSKSTIDRMISDNEFIQPTYLISKVKKRLWDKELLNKWLDEECKNPKASA